MKAKIEGRSLPKGKAPAASKPSDLLQALRESAGIDGKAGSKPTAANANKVAGWQKATKTAATAKTKPDRAQTRRAG